jgi:replicative DNA helicase
MIAADDEVSRLRVPPHSGEAEQSILGGLLLDCSALDRITDTVDAEDFYRAEHRAIFGAIKAMVAAGHPADVITVFERFSSAGSLDECGGLTYLNALAQSVPSAANIRRYAEIVRERANLRRIIAACDDAAASAFRAGTVTDVVASLSESIAKIDRQQMRVEPKLLSDAVLRALDRYTDAAEGKMPTAWPTGIAPLDERLGGGLRPGKVYGIAARPSVGKSSAARAIGLHLAAHGHPVLLLSQEMPADEVADCALAQLGSIDSIAVQTGNLSPRDWEGITDAAHQIAGMKFYVDDEGGLTPAQIGSKARSIKGLRVLVLDYLQLSSSTLKNANTNDQVAEISKFLKRLAMQMGIAVVVLSQLNRDVEKRADREPQLSDLRDSGAIEQDLDVAVMLWTIREPETGPRFVGWKVAKNRGGRKGRWGMDFDAAVYSWRESHEPLTQTAAPRGKKTEGYE